MIYLFLIDVLIYNVTTCNIPLFLILLPSQKTFKIPFIIFLFLSFFEYHYVLLLVIIFTIYSINKIINKYFQDNIKLYLVELFLDYSTYFILIYWFKSIIL